MTQDKILFIKDTNVAFLLFPGDQGYPQPGVRHQARTAHQLPHPLSAVIYIKPVCRVLNTLRSPSCYLYGISF